MKPIIVTTMARQGDVMMRRVPAIPAGVTPVEKDAGRVILAYGEVTGHSHALASPRVAMFMDTGAGTGGARFVRVDGSEPAALEHEEHDTVLWAPGDWEALRQVEYSPEAIRNVAD